MSICKHSCVIINHIAWGNASVSNNLHGFAPYYWLWRFTVLFIRGFLWGCISTYIKFRQKASSLLAHISQVIIQKLVPWLDDSSSCFAISYCFPLLGSIINIICDVTFNFWRFYFRLLKGWLTVFVFTTNVFTKSYILQGFVFFRSRESIFALE